MNIKGLNEYSTAVCNKQNSTIAVLYMEILSDLQSPFVLFIHLTKPF